MRRLLARVALAVTLSGVPSAAQAPVFRTGIDRVRVDVLVTDGDRPVAGMSVREFAIWDSGVPQTVEMIERGGPVKVLLVLDVSGSVAGSGLERLRAASMKLLDALSRDDEVGLLTFSDRLEQSVLLTRTHEDVRRALQGLDAGGRTALFDAVFTGLTMGLGESGRWLACSRRRSARRSSSTGSPLPRRIAPTTAISGSKRWPVRRVVASSPPAPSI
jgi:VWA domain-containing protein